MPRSRPLRDLSCVISRAEANTVEETGARSGAAIMRYQLLIEGGNEVAVVVFSSPALSLRYRVV